MHLKRKDEPEGNWTKKFVPGKVVEQDMLLANEGAEKQSIADLDFPEMYDYVVRNEGDTQPG